MRDKVGPDGNALKSGSAERYEELLTIAAAL
jgi:hypothetical protein